MHVLAKGHAYSGELKIQSRMHGFFLLWTEHLDPQLHCPVETVYNDTINYFRLVFVHIMRRTQTLSKLDVRVLGLEQFGVRSRVYGPQGWVGRNDDNLCARRV